ncbi:MAG: UDP-N-acetylglucosamine 2-epimerase (non-hydrolyzing) [Bacteroidetes bacterium]|nr:MAG: UDP-N-acetylglucosamine 2-epimerase (non-hydrolyzing) [Bacteroidota bacterium]
MKIISVVGARPNYIKITPLSRAIKEFNKSSSGTIIEHLLVHTGQHYDARMSRNFFTDLDIPEADINLGIGSGTHAEQVGLTMIAFEKVIKTHKPDWVVVVGDVNATLACSVTAKKEWVKCCHIEAGLRSGDLKMPEEINRLVTDRLSDLLFTTDKIANENLIKEGVPLNKICFVGNIMIDTLELNRSKAEFLEPNSIIKNNLLRNQNISDIVNEKYALITLHRPSNVDDKEILSQIIQFITDTVASYLSVIWPIHPRTYKNIQQFGLIKQIKSNYKIILTHPLGYHEMLRLNMGAKMMLTDSGGLQEECTILGTPCLTLRWNTERPITLRQHGGVSVLVGNNIDSLRKEYKEALLRKREPFRPELWDGKTASRIVNALVKYPIL